MATKGDVSDLDVLNYGGKPMIPMIQGFRRSRASGVVQSNVQGGLTRQRKKFYNNAYRVTAKFFLETVAQQDYIKVFFERNEGKPFICHCSADRPIVEPYVVQVVSEWDDTYVSQRDGELSVDMEIVSVRSPCLDDFLFDMYQCTGDDLYRWLTGINNIVKSAP